MSRKKLFNHKINLPDLNIQFQIPRLAILGVIFMGLFCWLMVRLYHLQILEGESIQQKYVSSIEKTQRLPGTRGRIYDRNGVIVADNRLSYDLTLEDSQNYPTKAERQKTLNGIAYSLIQIVNDDVKLNTVIPIELDSDGNYVYTAEGTRLSRFKADLYGKTKIEDMSPEEASISAHDMMIYLCSKEKFSIIKQIDEVYTEEEKKKFTLPDSYSDQDVLKIANIRYGLSLNSYRKYLPYTVATDISENAMIAIMENKVELQGADILQSNVRVYSGGDSMAPILGYTGMISALELESSKAQDLDYTNQSMIGKSGIEKSMENFLKGKDGMEQFYTDVVGNRRTDPEILEEPEAGQDIHLTIDVKLQDAVYRLLEQQIAGILLANMVELTKAEMPPAKEASQIRIPVDDVYFALWNNHVIDQEGLSGSEASELEQAVYQRFLQKKDLVKEQLYQSFELKGGSYAALSTEMQGYHDYIIIDVLKKRELLSADSVSWNREEKSFREYLTEAIKNGWIDFDQIASDEKYVNIEEEERLLEDKIMEYLAVDSAFELKIYEAMIREGSISPIEVCLLLYEQEVLPREDEDYQPLILGELDPYQFIRKKINNLQITPAQLALNPCSGSAVITNPQTGEVIACVTYPAYDNNRLANQMDSNYYKKLSSDLSLPMFNRATSQLTAPGSTFKPITVMAGLSEKVIMTDTSVLCDGVFDKVDPPLRCWNRNGHGMIKSSGDALQNSCNDYLCEITYLMGTDQNGIFSENVGLEKLQSYANMFDLNKKTGIELGEAEPHVTDQFAIPSSIGQGTHNYTTTQLARYTGTLANHGTSYQLSLIKNISETDGTSIQSFAPQVESQLTLPEESWNEIAGGMNRLVNANATLKTLQINAAGKTGTAEEAKNKPNHGLFIGYAPFEKPEIAVAVRIANGYSSGNVMGVAKGIFNYYFNLEEADKILTGKAYGVSNNVRTD